jgi:hypothetical protein
MSGICRAVSFIGLGLVLVGVGYHQRLLPPRISLPARRTGQSDGDQPRRTSLADQTRFVMRRHLIGYVVEQTERTHSIKGIFHPLGRQPEPAAVHSGFTTVGAGFLLH